MPSCLSTAIGSWTHLLACSEYLLPPGTPRHLPHVNHGFRAHRAALWIIGGNLVTDNLFNLSAQSPRLNDTFEATNNMATLPMYGCRWELAYKYEYKHFVRQR